MSDLFFHLGRSLGLGVIPAIRKSRWVWRSLTGDEAQSVRAEREFGQALAAELRLKVGTVHDPESLQLVRDIARRLSGCVRNKDRSFQVDVARVRDRTAMALPGGFVFVAEGLIQFCDQDPHELAFVIGHEMGHIIRGHALNRMLSRIGAEGLSSILSRGLLNPVLRQAGLQWLQSAHSREAELEADEFGVRVAKAAGYDPYAALHLFQRLEASRNQPQGIGDYFASHPPEKERRAHIQAVLRHAGQHALHTPTPQQQTQ
jgi:beta-barrel assembly-enhancing protease